MFSGEMGYSLFKYPVAWATLQGKYRGSLQKGGNAKVGVQGGAVVGGGGQACQLGVCKGRGMPCPRARLPSAGRSILLTFLLSSSTPGCPCK